MASIQDINRELKERLRSARTDSRADDWLQRLATHPRRRLAGKRRLHVATDGAADVGTIRQQ
ncbi:MAG: hypothetical protein AAFN78_15465 [Pseudomonadota bacterium]